MALKEPDESVSISDSAGCLAKYHPVLAIGDALDAVANWSWDHKAMNSCACKACSMFS